MKAPKQSEYSTGEELESLYFRSMKTKENTQEDEEKKGDFNRGENVQRLFGFVL